MDHETNRDDKILILYKLCTTHTTQPAKRTHQSKSKEQQHKNTIYNYSQKKRCQKTQNISKYPIFQI